MEHIFKIRDRDFKFGTLISDSIGGSEITSGKSELMLLTDVY